MNQLNMWHGGTIAERGAASTHLFHQVKCLGYPMNFLQRGPVKKYANKLWFYGRSAPSIFVQRALFAHSIVTQQNNFVVASGWAASNFSDEARHGQLTNNYS